MAQKLVIPNAGRNLFNVSAMKKFQADYTFLFEGGVYIVLCIANCSGWGYNERAGF